jgi:imidazoleglycerol phosphate synthase glutamine amidotransferase subunit HisH
VTEARRREDEERERRDGAVGELVAATSPYCGNFAAVIRDGAVMGTQSHPEKSQKAGFRLLRNFLAIDRGGLLA